MDDIRCGAIAEPDNRTNVVRRMSEQLSSNAFEFIELANTMCWLFGTRLYVCPVATIFKCHTLFAVRCAWCNRLQQLSSHPASDTCIQMHSNMHCWLGRLLTVRDPCADDQIMFDKVSPYSVFWRWSSVQYYCCSCVAIQSERNSVASVKRLADS